MIRNLFSSMVNVTKSFFSGIIRFPTFIKNQTHRLTEEFGNLHYRLNNMASSNMELGIYHLYSRNFRDAIFRFKLVDKFLDPDNKVANYWLGWVYFLKGSCKKSIIHLTKAADEDRVNLLAFVKSIDSATSIPDEIHEIHRGIVAELFIDKFISETENLPKHLVLALTESITNLPEEYSILELGSNIGFLGYEINKRMQESYTITSVEISNTMIKLQSACFPEQKLYDEVLHSPINEFLKQTNQQYDVICSLDGFAFEANLKNIFNSVFSILKSGGYFAFAVRSSANNTLSGKLLEFAHNNRQITDQLTQTGFNILSSKEIPLEIKNNYSIFVCTK